MQDHRECTAGKRRIFTTIAMAAGVAGAVIFIGPATADVTAHGTALHKALVGGGLIGLSGLLLSIGCLRDASLPGSARAEMEQDIAGRRLMEARQIIDEAARCAPGETNPST